VVWVSVVEAEPTGAGRRRPPLAARVQAVDGTGNRLLDTLVKLAGPRTQGAPAIAPLCFTAEIPQAARSLR